jgi:L-ascorbate metabolism protein UlaG (beta-lactamase superfamily)
MDGLGQVDVALLPVSGTYVMDAQEAAEAVKKIRPTHVVPMHWGSIVGSRADAERFAQLVAGLTTVHILDPQG